MKIKNGEIIIKSLMNKIGKSIEKADDEEEQKGPGERTCTGGSGW